MVDEELSTLWEGFNLIKEEEQVINLSESVLFKTQNEREAMSLGNDHIR